MLPLRTGNSHFLVQRAPHVPGQVRLSLVEFQKAHCVRCALALRCEHMCGPDNHCMPPIAQIAWVPVVTRRGVLLWQAVWAKRDSRRGCNEGKVTAKLGGRRAR